MAYFDTVQEFEYKLKALVGFATNNAHLEAVDWKVKALPYISRMSKELVEMFQQQVDKNEDINDTVLGLHQLINTLEDEIKDKDRDIDDLHKDMISIRNWNVK